jgi:hypothetical protein
MFKCINYLAPEYLRSMFNMLYSAFTTDQDLAQENSKCWFSTLNKIFKILKLDIKDLAGNSVFRNNLVSNLTHNYKKFNLGL